MCAGGKSTNTEYIFLENEDNLPREHRFAKNKDQRVPQGHAYFEQRLGENQS